MVGGERQAGDRNGDAVGGWRVSLIIAWRAEMLEEYSTQAGGAQLRKFWRRKSCCWRAISA